MRLSVGAVVEVGMTALAREDSCFAESELCSVVGVARRVAALGMPSMEEGRRRLGREVR